MSTGGTTITVQQVYEIIKVKPGLSSREIAALLDSGVSHITSKTRALLDRGKIEDCSDKYHPVMRFRVIE